MSGNSLSPGAMSATGSGRVKVSLGQGRSLMDWIRLTHANPNLSGVGGKVLDVNPEELARHSRRDDAWICLKGRVYNVTPYMEFHPGGEEELMRGVGKDATDLFIQVHKWVNFESMLEKCLVGRLVGPPANSIRKSSFVVPRIPFFKRLQRSDTGVSEDNPDLSEEMSSRPSMSYEWSQDDSTVTIVVQCKGDYAIEDDKVGTDLSGKKLRIRVRVSKFLYLVHIELQESVYCNYNVQVKCKLKCIELRLVKEKSGLSWSSLGTSLPGHNQVVPLKSAESFSRTCTLVDKSSVTHDVFLFTFALPSGSLLWVPIGHHISLEHDVRGMKISRSYTPVIPALKANQGRSDGKTVHLMIKAYPEGALTPVLKALQIGDTVEMKDTEGDFEMALLHKCHTLVLLAAGTGFTPMVRLLHWALFVSKQVDVKLMTFNKTVKDIIWKEELDHLLQEHNRLRVEHVLSEPDDSWEGARGRVRSHLLQGFVPSEDPRQPLLICVCGPLPFTKAALKCLEDMEYSPETVHAFLG
ncbi:cytochrome b5 reductase 4-like [Ixodes scapularis]|uniref:cytochrome b5 reductase 4-like n=1 Tax=Ixodes scapularis TaxID=6945 RepID=UPI001A9F8AC7|nr:cytochrome b5 reductase 4-like [Ixodes scapularis]